MNAFSRITQGLRGARRLEIFLALALVAVAALMIMGDGSNDGGPTTLEARMERTLSAIEGAGEVKVLINEGDTGEIMGVLVVAEGAGDMRVFLSLQNAVRALVDIDVSRIEIVRMEGK